MSLKELFEVGKSFESSVGEGTKGERARIFKNNSRLNINDEITNFIKNIDFEVNLLVSGEIWCPDFQLNITVLKRFLDLNSNFNMSVITMARGKKFMSPHLNIEKENFINELTKRGVYVCDFEINDRFKKFTEIYNGDINEYIKAYGR